MLRTALVGLALLLPSSALAQDEELRPVVYPKLRAFVHDASEFVPPGWKLVSVTKGDLGSDHMPDVAVLMRMNDAANVRPVKSPYYKFDDTNPYLLAIGFARQGGYVLAASNTRSSRVRPLQSTEMTRRGPTRSQSTMGF